MVTKQQVSGSWRELIGGIKQRWGELTDDDLTRVEGDLDQLVGLIQRKSGETRAEIEEYIEHLLEGSGGMVDTARQYADQARRSVQEASQQVTEQVQTGYVEAEKMMQRHPLESVAISFGVGLISGLVVGLMIRPK